MVKGAEENVGGACTEVVRCFSGRRPGSPARPLTSCERAMMIEAKVEEALRAPAQGCGLEFVDAVPAEAFFER
jgi:hypothetical protein